MEAVDSKLKKVVVIGAGLSGLAAVKEMLEAGHDVECFEQRHDIGGVFADMASYDSVLLTVSNYFMAYSDLMPFDEDVRFWTRAEYKQYLDRYAKKFDLLAHINFGWRLCSVEDPQGDCCVELMSESGEVRTVVCDHLVVCSGQFQEPNIPKLPGLETFDGEVLHSSSYKSASEWSHLTDKRVLFFGLGESAADVITEINEIAGPSVVSVRRHHCFSARHMGANMPIDVHQSRLWHSLPAGLKADSVRALWRTYFKRYEKGSQYWLMADYIVNSLDEPGTVATKTERIFEAIEAGLEMDVGGVESIQGNTVTFKSGRKQDFDAIVLCTGFRLSFSFLPDDYQVPDIRDLYLQAFHPALSDKVAFIGFCRPHQGGVPLMAEMQSRYAAMVFSGVKALPADLAGQAAADKRRWQREFYETPEVAGLVNGLRFNERLARLIGCSPKIPNILLDPRGFYAYWNFHIWPCQYRLHGPGERSSEGAGRWLQARDGIARGLDDISLKDCYAFMWKLFKMRVKSILLRDFKARWRPVRV